MEYGHIKLCKLNDSSINAIINQRLRDISVCDFFDMSPLQVMCICQLSYSQYTTLRNMISSHIAPLSCNVLSLYSVHLPTRITGLDNCLFGGLIPGTITEICGPPGSGKTQFCLTMATYCCMTPNNNGLGLKTIYIDTEGSFTAHRLIQIAKHLCSASDKVIKRTANNITVYTELTCESFNKRLTEIEKSLSINSGCGLLCIDSLASLLRKEYDTRTIRGLFDRSNTLSYYATRLKLLAEKYKLVIIMTNQIVVTIPRIPTGEYTDQSSNVEGVISASLGNTWFHCVNVRLMLKIKDIATGTRTLQIIKCPLSANNNNIAIRISSEGFINDNCADCN